MPLRVPECSMPVATPVLAAGARPAYTGHAPRAQSTPNWPVAPASPPRSLLWHRRLRQRGWQRLHSRLPPGMRPEQLLYTSATAPLPATVLLPLQLRALTMQSPELNLVPAQPLVGAKMRDLQSEADSLGSIAWQSRHLRQACKGTVDQPPACRTYALQ